MVTLRNQGANIIITAHMC